VGQVPNDACVPGRQERLVAWALLGAIVALRVACAFHYRIDSDEPQHLHVVWAWTIGKVPYRDVFDNHMPLFQLACAPLLWLVGEHPGDLVVMRLAMLPVFLGTLWCLGRIARRLFTARDALWTVVLSGLLAPVFFSSLEFRTDDAWMLCWFLALMTAIQGAPDLRRSAKTGFWLGMATAISLKTVLLLGAFAFAVGAVATLARDDLRRLRPHWSAHAMAFGAGLLAMPLVVLGGFAAVGALGPLLYGAVGHNLVPGLEVQHRPAWIRAACPALLLVLWSIGLWTYRRSRRDMVARRRLLVGMAAGAYGTLILTLWPLVTRQDCLPWLPLLVLAAVPSLRRAGDRLATRGRVPRWALPAGAATTALSVLLVIAHPWEDRTAGHEALVADTLRLTNPTDPVLDLKGDTIFRSRPVYYALEGLTRARLSRGLLRDDIPKILVETSTHVALAKVKGFPPRTRAFLRANYLPVGDLRVAGRRLPEAAPGQPTTFEIAVPGVYTIVGTKGVLEDALVDDQPLLQPRELAIGAHTVVLRHAEGPIAVVWAQAIERGFVPRLRAYDVYCDVGSSVKSSGSTSPPASGGSFASS
jgi:hypothetical protein